MAKAVRVLLSHHNLICNVLSVSETTLISFTGKLFSKHIVDRHTKNLVVSTGGYRGAEILLNHVEVRVKNKPQILHTILTAMQEQEALKDIVEQMKNWERKQISDGRRRDNPSDFIMFCFRIVIKLMITPPLLLIAAELFSIIYWYWTDSDWILHLFLLWMFGLTLLFFLGQSHSELKTSLILVWMIVGLIVNINVYQRHLIPVWIVYFSVLWIVGLISVIYVFWRISGHVTVISIKMLLFVAVVSVMLLLVTIGLIKIIEWYWIYLDVNSAHTCDHHNHVNWIVHLFLLWIVGLILFCVLGWRHSELKTSLILVWMIVGLIVNINVYQRHLIPDWIVCFSVLWIVGLILLICLLWIPRGYIVIIFTLLVMAVVSMMLILTVGLFLIIDSDCCCINSDGMQVIDEKHFAVTGGNTLDWVQFGLHIEVPEGSIQAGNTIELHVMAIIGGDFILLPDCYLVSGIYQISSSEQFKKNITLHLPHAAIIKSEEEASYFRFYTADCSSGPPYEFKEMQGGAFIPFHNSASIDVHHFSCFATGAIIPPNQRYLSQVLYKSAVSYSVKKWNMVFAITKNDPSFVKYVHQRFHDYHLHEDFLLQLQENATYLQIIPESHSISSWKVYEVGLSQIERTVIESYDPKNNSYIPHYTYTFIWQSDSSPSFVNLKFQLVGTHGDNKFSVLLPPEDIESSKNKGTDTVIKSTVDDKTGGLIPPDEDLLVHLHDVTKVQSFCIHLKLTLGDCDEVDKQNHENFDNQKIAILRKWKQIKEQRTWKEFIRPFALLENCAKAKELTIDHSVYFEEDLKGDKEVLERCKCINNHDL